MLETKYGKSIIAQYKTLNNHVRAKSTLLDRQTCKGKERIIYKFGESVMDHTSVSMTQENLKLSAFSEPIELPINNPYLDYC